MAALPSVIDGVMEPGARRAEGRPALELLDSCLRGVGQVIFMNNPITGLLILTGLTIASAWLGVATAIGVVAATLAARALGFERARRSAVGCTASTAPWWERAWPPS